MDILKLYMDIFILQNIICNALLTSNPDLTILIKSFN